MSNVYCQVHKGDGVDIDVQQVMKDLPRSQSGPGVQRHACAVCAYEQGLIEGVRLARAEMTTFLEGRESGREGSIGGRPGSNPVFDAFIDLAEEQFVHRDH